MPYLALPTTAGNNEMSLAFTKPNGIRLKVSTYKWPVEVSVPVDGGKFEDLQPFSKDVTIGLQRSD